MIATLVLLASLQGAVPQNHVSFITSVGMGAKSEVGAAGLAVGLHLTSARPNRVGMDLAMSTYVAPLVHGSFTVLTDLDAAYVSWGPKQPLVVLRAGLSALTAHGLGLGLNAGAGVLVPIGKAVSLRIDYTYRPLLGDPTGLTYSGLSAGVGVDY